MLIFVLFHVLAYVWTRPRISNLEILSQAELLGIAPLHSHSLVIIEKITCVKITEAFLRLIGVSKRASVLWLPTHNSKEGDRDRSDVTDMRSACWHVLPCPADFHCTSYPKLYHHFLYPADCQRPTGASIERIWMCFVFSGAEGSLFSGFMCICLVDLMVWLWIYTFVTLMLVIPPLFYFLLAFLYSVLPFPSFLTLTQQSAFQRHFYGCY